MKKLLFILLISVVSFSCSKDDEAITETVQTETQADQIVGEWQFGKVLYHQKDGTIETREPTVCDLQCSYTFLEDHSIYQVSYLNDGDGGCEFEPINREYFTWENISQNKYRLKSKNPTEQEEINIYEVSFPDSKTMIFKQYTDNDLSPTKYTENFYKKIP